MPWVLEWQGQRLDQEGQDAVPMRNAANAVFSEVERVLGVP
jgi:hypothetical protein